ncbi:MAG TPA: alkaline phosphatase family protein, partial [Opitutaceae bacterium]
TFYGDAHYNTANTFTSAGHATLATGTDAAGHGIVSNDWFDRDSGKSIYCVADTGSPVVGGAGKPVSPAMLLAPTLGDALLAARPGSRVFAVAGKDRSAILPGGKQGKAYWWLESTGGFGSSRYYETELPGWIAAWNATKPIDRYRSATWTPLSATESPEALANPHARPPAALGRSFPHPLLEKSDKLFFNAFQYTPFFDELIAAFARELIVREKLGRGAAPDYLAISFSGHDYIGHAYGPESPEYRDSLVRLDRVLAELLAVVEREVGLERTLIVLSSDHGSGDIPEKPELRAARAGRIHPDKLRAAANVALRASLKVDTDLITAFVPPGFYLDRAKLGALGLPLSRVEEALATHLRTEPGIAAAYSRTTLGGPVDAADPLFAPTRRAFFATRSGDVVVVQARGWYMYPDPEIYAAMHGSPYDYDTHVPILLAGPGVRAATTVSARVMPTQIVPTLAHLLGIQPPAKATAEVLPGVRR